MTTTTNCYSCGGEMIAAREKVEIRIGNKAAVVEVEGSRCKDCEELFYTPEQMDAAQMAASEQLRKEGGLLGPADIRRIRRDTAASTSRTVAAWGQRLSFVGNAARVSEPHGNELLRSSMRCRSYSNIARKNGIAGQVRSSARLNRLQVFGWWRLPSERHDDVVDMKEFMGRTAQRSSFI